jgi:hypothetical protein
MNLIQNMKKKITIDFYFLLIHVFILFFVFIYEFYENIILMQIIYLIILILFIISIIIKIKLIEFPIIMLLFILSTNEERLFILIYLFPSFFILNKIFNQTNKIDKRNNNYYKTINLIILIIIIIFSYNSYIINKGLFNMNVEVRTGTIGLLNAEHNPFISGFLMLFHKIGIFIILFANFAKLISDDFDYWQELNPSKELYFYLSSNSNIIIFIKIMILKSTVLIWTFHLAFWIYKDYLTCFIMTIITSVISFLFISLLLIFILSNQFISMLNIKINI